MFKLPRRGKEQYDNAKVVVYHLNQMENRIMASLEEVVAELQAAINNANVRFENVGQLEQALNDERAKYDALVVSEDAEDVQQNQELADARAATDHVLAQVQGLTGTLSGLTEQVNQLGQPAAAEAPAEAPAPAAPVESAPADAPADAAPVESAPADAPAADEATPADAPAEAPVDTPDESAGEADGEAPANPTP